MLSLVSEDYMRAFLNASILIENMEVAKRGMAIPFSRPDDRLAYVQVRTSSGRSLSSGGGNQSLTSCARSNGRACNDNR
jgi:hypothetical protein